MNIYYEYIPFSRDIDWTKNANFRLGIYASKEEINNDLFSHNQKTKVSQSSIFGWSNFLKGKKTIVSWAQESSTEIEKKIIGDEYFAITFVK